MTYAGRLDPMASGVLIVLAGEATKDKEKYLALGKEYEFAVLFGFTTDTHDILGKIVNSTIPKNINPKDITKNLKYFRGQFQQKYPLYSSKTVGGKQLWQYGRASEDVELPAREVLVHKFEFLSLKKIAGRRLLSDILKRIGKVEGDFRQKEILSIWRKNLRGKSKAEFFLASFKIKCGSGTYVRGLVDSLGERMGVPALAYRIKRTKVGKFVKIS